MTKLEEIARANRGQIGDPIGSDFEGAARAAVEAMREMSPQMVSAYLNHPERSAAFYWPLLIDAILNEQQ